MKAYKNTSYLDLGYDEFGLRRVQTREQISANETDYLLSLSENSVRSKKIQASAVINSKIKDGAVNTIKINDLAVTNAKINDLAADKLTTGTLTVAINVGEANTKIDGVNNRIIINDGITDRVLIGKAVGLF